LQARGPDGVLVGGGIGVFVGGGTGVFVGGETEVSVGGEIDVFVGGGTGVFVNGGIGKFEPPPESPDRVGVNVKRILVGLVVKVRVAIRVLDAMKTGVVVGAGGVGTISEN
jgi:hypothetical protein